MMTSNQICVPFLLLSMHNVSELNRRAQHYDGTDKSSSAYCWRGDAARWMALEWSIISHISSGCLFLHSLRPTVSDIDDLSQHSDGTHEGLSGRRWQGDEARQTTLNWTVEHNSRSECRFLSAPRATVSDIDHWSLHYGGTHESSSGLRWP